MADCTGTGQGIYAAWFNDCLVLSGCEQTDWLLLAWSSDYFSGSLFRCRAVNWCCLVDLLHIGYFVLFDGADCIVKVYKKISCGSCALPKRR